MSVIGYFSSNRGDHRMPRAASQPGPLNIGWRGDVLQGRISSLDALKDMDLFVRNPPFPRTWHF